MRMRRNPQTLKLGPQPTLIRLFRHVTLVSPRIRVYPIWVASITMLVSRPYTKVSVFPAHLWDGPVKDYLGWNASNLHDPFD